MRTNLENPRLYEPRISGLRLANVTFVMTGTLVIPNDAPSVWALDGGSADRTVRLPALTQDKQIIIGNVGGTNLIHITDSSGNALTDLAANSAGIFFAGAQRWLWVSNNS